eukprot:TRINITY_DN2824_c0_g1_i1.p1 TRINITY_DN2824_c0_g1~~TRINITY_DN2824_c0_g1_i1.p1  ORF type:complete len:256 (-),score=98.18 TRINITY_DN2824_c0_g1_i1:80-847(-)
MFRNQYDSDITTWSPQGRLHQIEYAMEAVKQGMPVVALKSNTHAVLIALNRASSSLASFQKKIFKIDEHMGVGIAGLTADARVLTRHMQTECLNHKFVYNSPLPIGRIVRQIADKSQSHTQKAGSRPYGLGMLIIGYDESGVHLFETCPSGNYFDYKAISIGSRSQSAKTYLEKTFTSYETASLNELIKHGLLAVKESIGSQATDELSIKNVSIAIVGKDTPFQILSEDQAKTHLAGFENSESGAAADESQPMEI